MDWKREGRRKTVNLWILIILGIFVLASYIRFPSVFFLVILMIVIVFLQFYLWYAPAYQRKKNADKIAKETGEYRLVITDNFIRFGEEQIQWMWKDLKIVFYVSEHMCTLKADRQVFAIPKRILSKKEQEEVMKIMRRQQVQILNIQIKKE